MLTFLLSLIISYLLLLLLPYWLVWPTGVLFSLYLVIIKERARGLTIDDWDILAVLMSTWLICAYGMLIFLSN